MPRIKICYVHTSKAPRQLGRVVEVFHEGDYVGPKDEDGPYLRCTDWLDVSDAELTRIMDGERVCDPSTGAVRVGVDVERQRKRVEQEMHQADDLHVKAELNDMFEALRGARFVRT